MDAESLLKTKKGFAKRMARKSKRKNGILTPNPLTLTCYGVSVAALVVSVVALVFVADLRTSAVTVGSALPAPEFRIKKNMITLGDGTPCVVSAAIPEGMKLMTSKAKRVEGRFHMIRVGDKRIALDAPQISNTSCAPPFAVGARWKQPFNIIIDPTNDAGIPRDLIVDHLWRAAKEWESRLEQIVINAQDTSGCADGFDMNSPDGKNEVMFGFIEEPGVLAMASTWGVFGGPVGDREIVEMDILYNLHFPWGNAASDPDAFGIWNVGSHEFGHGYGFGHTLGVPTSTMHATVNAGETQKRDLHPCEAAALCQHYGENHQCAANGFPNLQAFVDVGAQSRCGVFPGGPNGASAVGVGVGTSLVCMMVAAMA